jgi:hypothetical protein
MIITIGALRRVFLLLIVSAVSTGCEPGGKAEMELTQTLTKAAEAVAPGQALSLDKLVTQPWDQVLLFGPYTTVDLMKRAVGGELPPALQRIQIEQRDDVNAVVFLQGGKVVAAVALPRRVADFPKSELLRPVPRNQASLLRAASGVEFRWQGS